MPVEEVLYAPVASCEHVVVGGLAEGLVADVVPCRLGRLARFLGAHLRLDLGDGPQPWPAADGLRDGHGRGGEDAAGAGLHPPVVAVRLDRLVGRGVEPEGLRDGLVQSPLVVLHRKEVVRPLVEDLLRHLHLGAHGVDAHHGTGDVYLVEQQGIGGDLVLLVLDAELSDEQRVLADEGVEQVVPLAAPGRRVRAAQLLAVQRHLLLRQRGQELPAALHEAALYLVGVDGAHQPLESVGRRGAGAALEQPEVPCAGMGELRHVDVVHAVAEVGQQGDGQQVRKPVGAASRDTVVGD